jgi:hypothetical protein
MGYRLWAIGYGLWAMGYGLQNRQGLEKKKGPQERNVEGQ